MTYFTWVGSYDGAIKICGRWVGAKELNRIDKRGWRRVRPTDAALRAAKTLPLKAAKELFPQLAIA